jgi:mono/diheme cytochrome c family protein
MSTAMDSNPVRRLWKIPLGLALLVATGAAQSADASDGKALYTARCGMCHQTIGMAVAILSRRPGDTSKGLLEERTDLSAAFVRTVVRTGIVNMPRIARGEVSDPQLAQIADYLSRGKP